MSSIWNLCAHLINVWIRTQSFNVWPLYSHYQSVTFVLALSVCDLFTQIINQLPLHWSLQCVMWVTFSFVQRFQCVTYNALTYLFIKLLETLLNKRVSVIFCFVSDYANSGIYWTDGSNANAANFTDITQWTTSVNNPLPTTNEFWAQGEPAMPDLLHCSALGLLYGYQLASFDCLTTNYFICEKWKALISRILHTDMYIAFVVWTDSYKLFYNLARTFHKLKHSLYKSYKDKVLLNK